MLSGAQTSVWCISVNLLILPAVALSVLHFAYRRSAVLRSLENGRFSEDTRAIERMWKSGPKSRELLRKHIANWLKPHILDADTKISENQFDSIVRFLSRPTTVSGKTGALRLTRNYREPLTSDAVS